MELTEFAIGEKHGLEKSAVWDCLGGHEYALDQLRTRI
jgi:hypothetical protein